MTNRKTTRRALVLSLLSLLLCCSMLVGTTFAWFTDSVTSGNNQIVAGNLDVELYNAIGKDESKKVSESTKLFDEITLWEPGVVAYENLTVANVGTLALKYQLSVNFTNATATPEGKTLADVLKVAFVEGGLKSTTREGAIAEGAAAGWGEMKSFAQNGELKPGQTTEESFGIVIYWEPGENDNDYNMNNGNQGTTLSIDLGVNLLATQETYEEDSFDKYYDENAAMTTVVVTNEEELVAALAEANNGDVIGISGNVTWTTGGGHGSTPFVTDANTITLLGVTKDATFTAIGAGVGEVGIDGGTVTFKDLTIDDQSVSYDEGAWEFTYLEFRGNTVFENCRIVKGLSMDGESATFKNCYMEANESSVYAIWVSNGNATFSGCTIEGTRGLKVHEDYGSEIGTVIIDGCNFGPLSKKPGLAIGDVNADTTIKLTNNVFAGTQAGDQGNFKYETDTDVTTFNFTDENNTVSKVVDAAVTDAASLATALSGAGQAGAGNTLVKLPANAVIDMTGETWSPIKVDGYHGADIVTIDGNGATLKGLTAPLFAGGFAGGSGIVIKNLTIADSDIVSTSTQGSGAFVECVDSMAVITLENCHLKNSTLSGSRTGGLIGWTSGYNNVNDGPVKTYITVKNCSVVNCELNATGSLGGIIGHSGANAWTFTVIDNCTVKDCQLNSTDDGGWRVGTVIGTVNVGEQNDIINATSVGNTLTQTGKTAPAGQSELYGRFVPGTTGKLTIDGTAVN